jgi:ankyrin repeat protein
VQNKNLEVITTLLKAGAKLDDRDDTGQTPLMNAAQFNTPEVITTLLEAGADGKVKDNDGKTAFDCAKDNTKLKGIFAYALLASF